MRLLIPWLLLAAAGACASGDNCPSGTELVENSQGEGIERWCARPDGVRHGHYELRSRQTLRGAYIDGRKHGVWIFHGAADAWYYMDHGTGVEMAWYPGLQKKREQAFREGLADGPATEWYVDGTLKAVEHWHAGKKTSRWYEWHPKGQPKAERTYEADRLVSENTWPPTPARPRTP